MAYLVLARKYRPQVFGEMSGQEHVVRTISNALRTGQLAHAFLFTGPRGVGKTTTARLVAKALNCERGPTAEPCGTCTPCVEIAEGRAVDVVEIDAASNNGVDNVRDIVEAEGLRPLFVKTEFSKDRRAHSASGRGMTAGYVPHVFTVEMPHQVAIVSSILGDAGEVTDAWHHDMILSDGRISHHGEGALTLMHARGVPSYNFSCLQGFRHLASTYRCVKVYCEGRINVCGYYSTTVDLDGAVHVYKAHRLLRQVALKDDSLKNGLQEALECLSQRREPVSNLRFGIDVLRVIEEGRRVAAASI